MRSESISNTYKTIHRENYLLLHALKEKPKESHYFFISFYWYDWISSQTTLGTINHLLLTSRTSSEYQHQCRIIIVRIYLPPSNFTKNATIYTLGHVKTQHCLPIYFLRGMYCMITFERLGTFFKHWPIHWRFHRYSEFDNALTSNTCSELEHHCGQSNVFNTKL